MSKEYKEKAEFLRKAENITSHALTYAFLWELSSTLAHAKSDNYQKRERDEIDLFEKVIKRALFFSGEITEEEIQEFEKKLQEKRTEKWKRNLDASINRILNRKKRKRKKRSKTLT